MSVPDKFGKIDMWKKIGLTWHCQTGGPNPMTQLPPRKPTVLIRGTRWIFLISGIFYGATRLSFLTKREKPITELHETLEAFAHERRKAYRREFDDQEMLALYYDVIGVDKADDPTQKKH
ncbi:uncharacterized protein LOC127871058 [Dreissena polymorpha]|uniref:ATP synthase F(0) complex subunit e, mitochondrial n=1 Tax=Dreissena polymorpha TaxID=45954 RepID=A0A9D4LCJ4_DREPO|nr:uncharacterized protein LOC127871058 [Dreissena polymorpha]KAH3855610.1 hypothetical protein DPMN_098180 [Dreissena polymorpha]